MYLCTLKKRFFKTEMKPTAILLLHCPDQQGIISEVTKFITDNKGNIVDLDQYVDHQDGMFFMRVQWELDSFLIPREKIKEYIETHDGKLESLHATFPALSVTMRTCAM